MDPTGPLDKLVATRTISPQSREWIIAALDPYHDFKVKPVGFPDLAGVDTVVLCINGTMSIACPASVTEGTWDCHVFNLPNLKDSHMQALHFTPAVGATTISTGGLATIKDFGFINAVSCATGANTLPTAETTNLGAWADSVTVNHMSPELPPGAGRVIAAGFEVTNTTSALNQQGSVRCYRCSGNTVYTEVFSETYSSLPNVQSGPIVGTPDTLTTVNFYGPNSNLATLQGGEGSLQPPRRLVERGMLPPGTVADATNIPSSVQWHAREGGYSVCTFNDLDNKLEVASNHGFMMVSDDGKATEVCLISSQSQPQGDTLMHQAKQTFIQPLSIAGQYYTGLSLETTLTVTYRLYYEFAPAPGNVFMALAKPGCPLDDEVFDIYAKVVAQLPLCVPVRMNSFGSFFKSVGNFLKNIVTGKTVSKIIRVVAPQAGEVADKMDQVGDILASKSRPRTAQSNASARIAKR